jgi:prepilin-type processing-associated H-X9-DG protein
MSETGLPPEQRLSYLVELLPFVEAAPRPPFDKTKPWDSEENKPHLFRYRNKEGVEKEGHWGHYRPWLCPSKPKETPLDQFSVTHYVGIAGIGHDAISRPSDAPGIGFFGYDRTLSLNDIKNNLTNTLIVIETELINGPWVASGYPTVRGLVPDSPAYLGKGGQFGGIHRGGANALFADGSVRFLTDDMDRKLLEAMVSIERIHP